MAGKPRDDRSQPLPAPFTVIVDTREQAPFAFADILADKPKQNADGSRRIAVPVAWRALKAGDYSIEGWEDRIAIERKSPADLFGTLGARRSQFEREHERLAEIIASGGWAAVVIESNWTEMLRHPPEHSRLKPKTAFRTSISWARRYRVPWVTCDSRPLAEVWTYRALESFWKDQQRKETTAAA